MAIIKYDVHDTACSTFLTFSPFAVVSLFGVAGLAETFPSFTVSGPFLFLKVQAFRSLLTVSFHRSLFA